MADEGSREPQILVPYPGPQGDGSVQDIFVYLRPETNGVLVESALLKVVQSCPQYRTGIKLVYLANIPGDFIVSHHIIERHYAYKFFFAVHGGRAFTTRMKEEFERHFGVPASDVRVLGSFEALRELRLTPEELFSRWVAPTDMLHVDGQTIKRYDDVYVVNYDLPALMQKNTRNTDIAVMLFRCSVDYDYFVALVDEMRVALVDRDVLSQALPASRAFHYSKGPLEQLLDATDYLRTPEGDNVPFEQLSFVAYAQQHGFTPLELREVIRSPICLFEREDGSMIEESLFVYTATDTYEEALAKLRRIRAQLWIR